MADLNRSYLRAELEHFEARRESDTKLRMFRHDIRNHLLCIRELAARGNYSGLSDYIGELEGRLELTDTSLHCGNDIGDAILNEKICWRPKGHRDTAGRPPAFSLPVDAADICALFANALDNALEAQLAAGGFRCASGSRGRCSALCLKIRRVMPGRIPQGIRKKRPRLPRLRASQYGVGGQEIPGLSSAGYPGAGAK